MNGLHISIWSALKPFDIIKYKLNLTFIRFSILHSLIYAILQLVRHSTFNIQHPYVFDFGKWIFELNENCTHKHNFELMKLQVRAWCDRFNWANEKDKKDEEEEQAKEGEMFRHANEMFESTLIIIRTFHCNADGWQLTYDRQRVALYDCLTWT